MNVLTRLIRKVISELIKTLSMKSSSTTAISVINCSL